MEAISQKWRVGVVLGVLGGLLAAGDTSWFQSGPGQAPPEAVAEVAIVPIVDLASLYTLDHLMFGTDPVLDLRRLAPVGAGPPARAAVPEPRVAALWILALTVLYALYLPARTC